MDRWCSRFGPFFRLHQSIVLHRCFLTWWYPVALCFCLITQHLKSLVSPKSDNIRYPVIYLNILPNLHLSYAFVSFNSKETSLFFSLLALLFRCLVQFNYSLPPGNRWCPQHLRALIFNIVNEYFVRPFWMTSPADCIRTEMMEFVTKYLFWALF